MFQILLALLAGVLTIAAPCIFPLLPILLGTSIGHTSKTRPLFIVAGFILVFSVAALFLSFLSTHAGLNSNVVRNIGIAALALFGIFMLIPSSFDAVSLKLNSLASKSSAIGGTGQGSRGAFILGMTLGVVWTPCAGPVLASVLALIALQKELLTAGILLVAYSIGASVPMLILAYAGQYLTTQVEWLARYTPLLQKIFGLIIILVAIGLYFNYDTLLYAKLLG